MFCFTVTFKNKELLSDTHRPISKKIFTAQCIEAVFCSRNELPSTVHRYNSASTTNGKRSVSAYDAILFKVTYNNCHFFIH